MANEYLFMIGTSSADSDMVNVEELDSGKMPAPKALHFDYSDYLPLADNSERGIGFPFCIWKWGEITFAQRNALRAYCPGASVSVYVQTMTNDYDSDGSEKYERFAAQMIWQRDEGNTRDAEGTRIEFALEFRRLVVV